MWITVLPPSVVKMDSKLVFFFQPWRMQQSWLVPWLKMFYNIKAYLTSQKYLPQFHLNFVFLAIQLIWEVFEILPLLRSKYNWKVNLTKAQSIHQLLKQCIKFSQFFTIDPNQVNKTNNKLTQIISKLAPQNFTNSISFLSYCYWKLDMDQP